MATRKWEVLGMLRGTNRFVAWTTTALGAALLAPGAQARDAGPFDLVAIPAAPTWSTPIELAAPDWTLSGWVRLDGPADTADLLALSGDTGPSLTLGLADGRPLLSTADKRAQSKSALTPGRWHFLSLVASAQGIALVVDGKPATRLSAPAAGPFSHLDVAPSQRPSGAVAAHFAGLRLETSTVSPGTLAERAKSPPEAALIQFTPTSAHWLLQTRQMEGTTAPQPSGTLPSSATPPDAPVAKPLGERPALVSDGPARWTIGDWYLAQAPDITGEGSAISRPGFTNGKWYAATVPGTVLTTFIDRGVYPDPTRGLNNLAIPEKLAHQDYWYRTEFELPAEAARRKLELRLNGANYAAQVWVNGTDLGTMTGAFIRGRYDVSALLKPGRNAIAVRISPPPHPGHAQEESLTSGVGENGGAMMLDGPTFGASEGWDWIPTIRDRETGLWQDVQLIATGAVRLGDPRIVTTLPRPDNSLAEVEISVPVENQTDTARSVEVTARFDEVALTRKVTAAPHATTWVRFDPSSDPALAIHDPKLWWPNGYGAPNLHTLHLAAKSDGETSDTRDVRFGMRQVTYEMSLVDEEGALERVALDFQKARQEGRALVDIDHSAIREVRGGWSYSFAKGAEHAPAVTPIAGDEGLSPYLVIRVNGVRIAARGGSVGMDDFLKRTDRAHLEPYFKLQHDAHVNVIRNWVGQNTQKSFFDLADEYGLMVMSDFWESTQNYNIEAEDPGLFMANARDVVQRFRNHPSIVLWFGRNEGVPQPILNRGLDAMLREEDGTRLYMPSSNTINLHTSGPYNWQPPEKYFTEYSKGFAVEVGTPSFPTLEAWQRAIPESERWPISDTWAYHDWHQTGNGAVKTFTGAMDAEFGAPSTLTDFARKAQMLEYESYRAIFEGMNAGLWTTNSGRMLWMTQPAWPSSAWQIFSHDYDTHGAFYGMKKASEAVHVQMNLPDHKVILVNNTLADLSGMKVTARVEGLDGSELTRQSATLSAAAQQPAEAFTLDLAPLMAKGPVLVRLEATDPSGTRVSDNFYWQAASPEALRAMSALPAVALQGTARKSGEGAITVSLTNPQSHAAIQTKLTLFGADGTQILPAYFTDNYVSLLPGETREVTITAAPQQMGENLQVRLRGFNVTPQTIAVGE
ncbi:beta galactosidase jelly roll domain-containing protein [Novosphingobium profundi]|nr:beta galactosidase jelly roll domain-containing protein [Novosphingobium profundi]